jgi:ABC-type nickel/cobalt efflux system permease component RcnA
MRRGLRLAGLGVAVALALLWATGGAEALGRLAAEAARAGQERLAGAVRALRGGEAGALAALLGVAFLYGLAHAAGPGHGKLAVGGYGIARRVPAGRLAALAVLAALAQAGVAVALVHGTLALVGWTRAEVLGLAEGAVPAVGTAFLLALGLWLAWRGGRGLAGGAPGGGAGPGPTQGHGQVHAHARGHARGHGHAHTRGHGHGHDHAGDDCGCGHRHGPSVEEAAAVTDWRGGAALIAAVALRPCSGALFLLILTWQLGIGAAGIAGAFAMAAGTAAVTVAAALLSVWAREGALAALPGRSLARAGPVVELTLGVLIAVVAAGMLAPALGR